MRIGRIGLVSAAVAALACGSSETGGSGGDARPIKPVLAVDANRDGQLDLEGTSDEAGKNDFSALAGAVLLANLDDDDRNHAIDAANTMVDGDADTSDLARFAVAGLPLAPDNASAALAIDAMSAMHVHLFRVTGPADKASSYSHVATPTSVPLTAAELRTGAIFAIEADAFAGGTADGWDGRVRITLTAYTGGTPAGTDAAQLRVAPLVFQWNTAPTSTIYYSDFDIDSMPLRRGLAPACNAGIQCRGLVLEGDAEDQWTQDFFDVGYTSMPAEGGTNHGLRVLVRSAQPDRLAGEVVYNRFLAPDFGVIDVHGPMLDDSAGLGYSMNSFGNWDVVPPHEHAGATYPLGRNIYGAGSDAANQPDPVFVAFVKAQAVQPPIVVDTSWLVVGHVDEYFTWVKTNTPRGWGMLYGDPARARQMLLDLQAAGHGADKLFAGLQTFDYADPNEPVISAEATIDQVLANADLMAESQNAQVEIETAIELMKSEVGLDAAEFTSMPFLFSRVYGAALAYQPGTVNLLHADGRVVVPKPFGPTIDGKDPFETDVETRLGALGLAVGFADDWDLYHVNMGEVHCGTNVAREIASNWWETGR